MMAWRGVGTCSHKPPPVSFIRGLGLLSPSRSTPTVLARPVPTTTFPVTCILPSCARMHATRGLLCTCTARNHLQRQCVPFLWRAPSPARLMCKWRGRHPNIQARSAMLWGSETARQRRRRAVRGDACVSAASHNPSCENKLPRAPTLLLPAACKLPTWAGWEQAHALSPTSVLSHCDVTNVHVMVSREKPPRARNPWLLDQAWWLLAPREHLTRRCARGRCEGFWRRYQNNRFD